MSTDVKQICIGLAVAVLASVIINVGVQLTAMYQSNALFNWRIGALEERIVIVDSLIREHEKYHHRGRSSNVGD